MLFSSMVFLFLFLPVVCAVYFLVPKRLKNDVLLAASFVFYAWKNRKRKKSRENPQKQQVLCSSRQKHVSSDEISCLFVQEGSRKKENAAL